jgi:hypothetical protein
LTRLTPKSRRTRLPPTPPKRTGAESQTSWSAEAAARRTSLQRGRDAPATTRTRRARRPRPIKPFRPRGRGSFARRHSRRARPGHRGMPWILIESSAPGRPTVNTTMGSYIHLSPALPPRQPGLPGEPDPGSGAGSRSSSAVRSTGCFGCREQRPSVELPLIHMAGARWPRSVSFKSLFDSPFASCCRRSHGLRGERHLSPPSCGPNRTVVAFRGLS